MKTDHVVTLDTENGDPDPSNPQWVATGFRDGKLPGWIEAMVGDDGKAANAAPTPAQAEAGNYQKKHLMWNGLGVSVETPKGEFRRGTNHNGESWEVKMPVDYGYLKRTEGADGDHVDVFVGDEPDAEKVYVVDQKNLDSGEFDEHKCMIGFKSKGDAMNAYQGSFSDGRGGERAGAVTEVDVNDFKEWVKSGDTKKPFANNCSCDGDDGEYSEAVKKMRSRIANMMFNPAAAFKGGGGDNCGTGAGGFKKGNTCGGGGGGGGAEKEKGSSLHLTEVVKRRKERQEAEEQEERKKRFGQRFEGVVRPDTEPKRKIPQAIARAARPVPKPELKPEVARVMPPPKPAPPAAAKPAPAPAAPKPQPLRPESDPNPMTKTGVGTPPSTEPKQPVAKLAPAPAPAVVPAPAKAPEPAKGPRDIPQPERQAVQKVAMGVKAGNFANVPPAAINYHNEVMRALWRGNLDKAKAVKVPDGVNPDHVKAAAGAIAAADQAVGRLAAPAAAPAPAPAPVPLNAPAPPQPAPAGEIAKALAAIPPMPQGVNGHEKTRNERVLKALQYGDLAAARLAVEGAFGVEPKAEWARDAIKAMEVAVVKHDFAGRAIDMPEKRKAPLAFAYNKAVRDLLAKGDVRGAMAVVPAAGAHPRRIEWGRQAVEAAMRAAHIHRGPEQAQPAAKPAVQQVAPVAQVKIDKHGLRVPRDKYQIPPVNPNVERKVAGDVSNVTTGAEKTFAEKSQELLKRILDAGAVKVDRLTSKGINESFKIMSAKDGKPLGAFKPVVGEADTSRAGALHVNLKEASGATREMAAFDVATKLGIKMPAVTKVSVDEHGEGSVMEYVDSGPKAWFPVDNVDKTKSSERLAELAMMDYVIGQFDRHPGNFMVSKDGTIEPIDNGLTFPNGDMVSRSRGGGPARINGHNGPQFIGAFLGKGAFSDAVTDHKKALAKAGEIVDKIRSPEFSGYIDEMMKRHGFSGEGCAKAMKQRVQDVVTAYDGLVNRNNPAAAVKQLFGVLFKAGWDESMVKVRW